MSSRGNHGNGGNVSSQCHHGVTSLLVLAPVLCDLPRGTTYKQTYGSYRYIPAPHRKGKRKHNGELINKTSHLADSDFIVRIL